MPGTEWRRGFWKSIDEREQTKSESLNYYSEALISTKRLFYYFLLTPHLVLLHCICLPTMQGFHVERASFLPSALFLMSPLYFASKHEVDVKQYHTVLPALYCFLRKMAANDKMILVRFTSTESISKGCVVRLKSTNK